jgi:hypothetical protein
VIFSWSAFEQIAQANAQRTDRAGFHVQASVQQRFVGHAQIGLASEFQFLSRVFRIDGRGSGHRHQEQTVLLVAQKQILGVGFCLCFGERHVRHELFLRHTANWSLTRLSNSVDWLEHFHGNTTVEDFFWMLPDFKSAALYFVMPSLLWSRKNA